MSLLRQGSGPRWGAQTCVVRLYRVDPFYDDCECCGEPPVDFMETARKVLHTIHGNHGLNKSVTIGAILEKHVKCEEDVVTALREASNGVGIIDCPWCGRSRIQHGCGCHQDYGY